jgi:hypothetical protein
MMMILFAILPLLLLLLLLFVSCGLMKQASFRLLAQDQIPWKRRMV